MFGPWRGRQPGSPIPGSASAEAPMSCLGNTGVQTRSIIEHFPGKFTDVDVTRDDDDDGDDDDDDDANLQRTSTPLSTSTSSKR